MIALDGVRYESQADLVHRPMPSRSRVVAAGQERLLHLGVSEGLGLAVIPSEAAKDAQVFGDLLLRVIAEAVFQRAEVLVAGNPWRLVDAGQIRLDRLAISAHVGRAHV